MAFDKLGHKLITGIANTVQSRWERARSNVTPNRSERPRVIVSEGNSAAQYRQRVLLSRRNSFYGSYAPQVISTVFFRDVHFIYIFLAFNVDHKSRSSTTFNSSRTWAKNHSLLPQFGSRIWIACASVFAGVSTSDDGIY